jgi:acyl-CoA synthetase (AMP-forming)/AMP-acid ligase II
VALAPTPQADVSWCAVLAHHATRTPDKAITVFEGEITTYSEMAERAAMLAGGLRFTPATSACATRTATSSSSTD